MKIMLIEGILVLTLLVDIVVAVKLFRAFKLLGFPRSEDESLDHMPSVTICVTARNETHAMTQCLERIVTADYPKLEVIVLDDGSRDNTSILIKSFAHAGVRFIEGKELPHGWLGKNYAQSVLAKEASGEYVFFLDVDTQIEHHTVSRAVKYLQVNKAKMVSVIPLRSTAWQTSALMSTLRHFWTVLYFQPHYPRAAANAWLIEREVLLKRFNEDETLPLSMQVETTIARHLAQSKEYRLVLSNEALGLRYEKRWSSQVETSIRLLYPQHGRKWYRVMLTVLLLAITLLPYTLLLVTPWALLLIIFQFAIAGYYLIRVWRRYWLAGALILPITLMQELVLLLVSFYRYNFGTITWKGRPITSKSTASK